MFGSVSLIWLFAFFCPWFMAIYTGPLVEPLKPLETFILVGIL